MITVEYMVSEPWNWFKQLEDQLPAKITGTTLVFDKKFGEGSIEYIEVQEGFWIQKIDLMLHEDIRFNRITSGVNSIFVLDFYLFDFVLSKSFNNKSYNVGFQDVSLVLTSANTASSLFIPKNKRLNIINIAFTREWIYANAMGRNDKFFEMFRSDDPLYLSEDLDSKLKYLIGKVEFSNNKLTTLSNTIQIIDYFFSKIKMRGGMVSDSSRLHPVDFENLILVKNYLDENVLTEISLETLAKKSGMSLSKFKKNFKQVFGVSPYRYHLNNKMEKSMEILKQDMYSVSEVGNIMGYSNLSHFSKAFKDHFGLLPSEAN